MQLDINLIKNKQRIFIGGTHGVDEIFHLTRQILHFVGKPVDFYTIGEPYEPSDAPVVIIRGGEELENGNALFLDLDIHILLLHRIKDKQPKGYHSLEEYVEQYEKLADALPKAGTFIFNVDDNLATLIGKKEREDVKNIEYTALPAQETESGFIFKLNGENIEVKTTKEKFPKRLAGVKALLNRIGVVDAQIASALKSFS